MPRRGMNPAISLPRLIHLSWPRSKLMLQEVPLPGAPHDQAPVGSEPVRVMGGLAEKMVWSCRVCAFSMVEIISLSVVDTPPDIPSQPTAPRMSGYESTARSVNRGQ